MRKLILESFEFFAVLGISFLLMSFLSRFLLKKAAFAKWLVSAQNKGGWIANVLAALVGAVTPFCVCTTMPIFSGLLQIGVRINVAMSFLFSSPLINISTIVLMFFLFGWKFSFYFAVATLLFSVWGGLLVKFFKLDDAVIAEFTEAQSKPTSLIKMLFLPLALGALIGGLIHNYVPVTLIENFNRAPALIVIPLMALIGFPLYLNILALTPVCASLVSKGINPAAVMTLMMSGAGISLPTAIVLQRILKRNLFIYYILYTFISYCLIGFIFNLLK